MTRKTTATKTKAAPAKTPRARKTTSTKTKLPASDAPTMETVAEVVALATPTAAETVETPSVETPSVETPSAETPAVESVEVAAVAMPSITREAFELRVRRAAWRRANARGFRNGSPFEDWIQAEAEVRAALDAEGVRLDDAR